MNTPRAGLVRANGKTRALLADRVPWADPCDVVEMPSEPLTPEEPVTVCIAPVGVGRVSLLGRAPVSEDGTEEDSAAEATELVGISILGARTPAKKRGAWICLPILAAFFVDSSAVENLLESGADALSYSVSYWHAPSIAGIVGAEPLHNLFDALEKD